MEKVLVEFRAAVEIDLRHPDSVLALQRLVEGSPTSGPQSMYWFEHEKNEGDSSPRQAITLLSQGLSGELPTASITVERLRLWNGDRTNGDEVLADDADTDDMLYYKQRIADHTPNVIELIQGLIKIHGEPDEAMVAGTEYADPYWDKA